MRLAWIFSLLLLSACTTTDLITTDLTRQRGLYVIGYIDRDDIRVEIEDRLVRDLVPYELVAVASHFDIAKIKDATAAEMVAAANSHNVAAVLIINRVSRDGADSIITEGERITPDNPDLLEYYELTKDELDNYDNDEAVFAEVHAFFIDGEKTRRFWTGTTWSFDVDNQGGAIAGISATIAAELAKVRDEIRSYERPMN